MVENVDPVAGPAIRVRNNSKKWPHDVTVVVVVAPFVGLIVPHRQVVPEDLRAGLFGRKLSSLYSVWIELPFKYALCNCDVP